MSHQNTDIKRNEMKYKMLDLERNYLLNKLSQKNTYMMFIMSTSTSLIALLLTFHLHQEIVILFSFLLVVINLICLYKNQLSLKAIKKYENVILNKMIKSYDNIFPNDYN